jgi:hypothetical protein
VEDASRTSRSKERRTLAEAPDRRRAQPSKLHSGIHVLKVKTSGD